MSQIKKKWIGNKQVDGNKILLENAQPLKAKLANATEVELLSINGADEVEMLKAPIVNALGTSPNSLQAKSQIEALILPVQSQVDLSDAAIVQEIADRIAGDAALQTALNSGLAGFDFKYGAICATLDAGLAAAVEGDSLAPLLPFSDDEGTTLAIGDFAAGNYILSKNGVNSKVMKLYDDLGTLKITFIGFAAMADGHGYMVKYDLPDSPASQESNALYKYDGVDLNKIGDFDWSLASGIDMGIFPSDFSTGDDSPIISTDSVNAAIAKVMRRFYVERVNTDAVQAALELADSNEQSARIAADGSLQTQIDNISAGSQSYDY
jgi:hypothetical protein